MSQGLVCCALPEEISPAIRREIEARGHQVLITCMGTRAVKRALAGVSPTPDWVLSTGFCGGMQPRHRTGTVIGQSQDPTLLQILETFPGIHRGRFHHSEKVVTSAREKQALGKDTGADAVDMESVHITQWADSLGRPSAVIRAVSDTVQDDLPFDFNLFADQDGRFNLPRFLLHLAPRPWKIPALLTLQGNAAKARKALDSTLHELLPLMESAWR